MLSSRILLWSTVLLGSSLLISCAGTLKHRAPPRNGYIRPQAGMADPIVSRGVATGAVSLKDGRLASSGCKGYVTGEPSFVLELQEAQPFLRIFVESHMDTTLTIRTPEGTYMCDDNTYGWNPAIEGGFRTGLYSIWVGGARRDLNASYQIAITRRHDVTTAGGPPPSAPPPSGGGSLAQGW